ncbi:MAG: hypothetical protein ACRYGL_00420 [Janthinobacterium lividum]
MIVTRLGTGLRARFLAPFLTGHAGRRLPRLTRGERPRPAGHAETQRIAQRHRGAHHPPPAPAQVPGQHGQGDDEREQRSHAVTDAGRQKRMRALSDGPRRVAAPAGLERRRGDQHHDHRETERRNAAAIPCATGTRGVEHRAAQSPEERKYQKRGQTE